MRLKCSGCLRSCAEKKRHMCRVINADMYRRVKREDTGSVGKDSNEKEMMPKNEFETVPVQLTVLWYYE